MCNNQFLSPHFRLREFTESATARKHGIVNEAPPEAVENLRHLCDGCLEPLREKLGLPVIITSGYRCKRLNEILVHAARKSQHMAGQAADFYISSAGFKVQGCPSGESAHARENSSELGSPLAQSQTSRFKEPSRRELLIRAFRLIIEDDGIDFDQLILYPTFIHVSYVSKQVNRHKLTKANGQGTYCALTREQALKIQ